jgi:predicted SAM-dependent methyltransferase
MQENKPLKLHLGCGGVILDGYINIDVQPCPRSEAIPDEYHDLREPLPYDNVDEILSDGVIIMFSRPEWKHVKKMWCRMLRPGGKMDLTFPDFEDSVRRFLDCKTDEKWGYKIQTIFGGHDGPYDIFKNAFGYENLIRDLEEEGMENFVTFPQILRGGHTPFLRLVCTKKHG